MSEPGRKIPLDASLYCPHSGTSRGGDPACDHDYPPDPIVDDDDFGTWQCTRCGMRRTYEVWQ